MLRDFRSYYIELQTRNLEQAHDTIDMHVLGSYVPEEKLSIRHRVVVTGDYIMHSNMEDATFPDIFPGARGYLSTFDPEVAIKWAFEIGRNPTEWLLSPDPQKRKLAEYLCKNHIDF